jgi:UDP-N-acetylglucosamine 4-epimerase
VVGVDNFITGKQDNLDDVRSIVGEKNWSNFSFFEGDLRDYNVCEKVSKLVDIILHQAALGSVPRSVKDPLSSHEHNVNGFLNLILAAIKNNVGRFIYASSSSVYGDDSNLPKVESVVGKPLSPYALTNKTNELYAEVFSKTYQLEIVGIRYFNVFGKRQDPNGPYAAVIPKWLDLIKNNEQVTIYGDGLTSRDFCYIDNVVQMNILAGATLKTFVPGAIFNCALSDKMTLNDLFESIRDSYVKISDEKYLKGPKYNDFRVGDVRHSQADITAARNELGFFPTVNASKGLEKYVRWKYENSR